MTWDINQLTAADLMTTDIVIIEENDSLDKVASRLLAKQKSNAPVVRHNNGKKELIGFVSERDVIECFFNAEFYRRPETPIRKVTRIHPVCIRSDTDLPKVACIFLQHGYRHLPVVDEGEFLGIVSRRDVMQGFLAFFEEQLKHEVDQRKPPKMDDTLTSPFIIG